MMYKTVTELANELNISRQAIQKRIKRLPPDKQPKKVGGKYRLSEEVVASILSFKHSETESTTSSDNPDATKESIDNHDFLFVVNEDKKQLYKIISNLEKRLEESQLLLNQQQQLTLQGNKQIEKLQLKLENTSSEEKESSNINMSKFKESFEEQEKNIKQIEEENKQLKEKLVELEQTPKKGFWQRLFNS